MSRHQQHATAFGLQCAQVLQSFDAKVAAQNSDYIGFSTPNAEALKLMDPSYAADPTYNPPQDVLDRCQIFQDLGDFVKVFSDAWTKVKAA